MNINVASQNQGVVAWSGGATPVASNIDLRNHIYFSFSFQVTADITTDAVFAFAAAPPSDTDPCVPGTFAPVPEVPFCDSVGIPSAEATVTIPAGTKAWSLCSGTLPCIPGAFLKPVAKSGDTAKVVIVAILSGPRR